MSVEADTLQMKIEFLITVQLPKEECGHDLYKDELINPLHN